MSSWGCDKALWKCSNERVISNIERMDCVTDCGTRRSQAHSRVRPLTVNLESSSVSALSLWAVDVSGPALSENGDALGCSEPQILAILSWFLHYLQGSSLEVRSMLILSCTLYILGYRKGIILQREKDEKTS